MKANLILIILVITTSLLVGVSQGSNKLYKGYRAGDLRYEDPRSIPGIIEVKEVPVLPGATDARLIPAVDLSSQMPPIGDQGAQGSCVGWAVGYYHKTHTEWIEHGWNVNSASHQYSPAFIYNQINGGDDDGAYFSDAMDILCSQGDANMVLCPYDEDDYTTWPSETAYSYAIPFRGDQGYWIDVSNTSGLQAVKQRLNNGYTTVLGIYVWSNFDNIENYNNTYCVADKYGINRGGHAVTIVGYNDNFYTNDGYGAFKLTNSWGTGWGASGYFWMSYVAVMNSDLSQLWAFYVTDRIGYQPTLLGRVRITHQARDKIGIRLGVGRTSSPQWQFNFREWRYSLIDRPFPSNRMVFDMTEGAQYIANGTTDSVFVRCIDDVADGKTGTISYFSSQYLPGNATGVSPDPPVSIPDVGVGVYARAKIPTFTDVSVTQILAPSGTIDSGSIIIPQARVKNFGNNQVSFPVIFRISPFYIDTTVVNNLNQGDSIVISFTPWLAEQIGTHPTKCSTALNSDQNHSNDWRTGSVTVLQPTQFINVWIPDTSGRRGDTIKIPMLVNNVPPDSVYATELSLSFNGNILAVESVYTGNAAQGWLLESQIYPDSITISMAGGTALANSGVLLWISFVVSQSASIGANDTIHFQRCMFNEGEISNRTQDGIFTVIPDNNFSISGYTNYYWTPYQAVPNAEMFLTGGRVDTILTDANGYYIFNNLPSSHSYMVTPRKINPQRQTAISSYDAALILRHVAGQITFDSLQSIAAEVSGNGNISSFDAALVLRYNVNQILHFPVGYRPGSDTVDWAFRPSSITYPNLGSNQTNQNYRAILYGDPSGNWSPSEDVTLFPSGTGGFIWGGNLTQEERTEFRTQDAEYRVNDFAVFPIRLTKIKDIMAADIVLTYDPDEIVVKDVVLGASANDYLIAWGTANGTLKIGLAGVRMLNDDAELAKVFYQIKDETKQAIPIEINSISLNEKLIINTPSDEGATANQTTLSNKYSLLANQPNPFKTQTTINYSLKVKNRVSLLIYDVSGKLIKTLVNKSARPGFYSANWNGTDDQGEKVVPGVYFYVLKADGKKIQKKMLMLK